MQSLFIKCGNQIVNREHVCGVQYNTFTDPMKMLTYKTKLTAFTTDGHEIVFYDAEADEMWNVFSDASPDLSVQSDSEPDPSIDALPL